MKQSLFFIGLVCLTATSLAQSTWYVNADASSFGDGTSWNQPFQYIEEAFASADSTDAIWVAAGTYTPGADAPSRTTWLQPTQNFKLYGGFAGSESQLSERDLSANTTTIQGDVLGNDVANEFDSVMVMDNLQHLMYLDTFINNSTVIDGITFTRGATDGSFGSGDGRRGGAILSYGSPIVSNCVFRENYGWFAGGLYPRGAFANETQVLDCRFENNAGGSGGGMYIVGGTTLTIAGCTFVGNTIENSGGAIRIQDTDGADINNCVFESNTSEGSGGAVNGLRAVANYNDCSFNGNMGRFGGALVNYTNGAMVLEGCTFSENQCTSSGGAMSLAFESTTTLLDCTFEENKSDESAAAIYIQGGEDPGDLVTIADISTCTFRGNESSRAGGSIWSRYSSEVTVSNCLFEDNISTQAGGAFVVGPDSLDLGETFVTDSRFLFNASFTQGGAVDVQNGDLIIANSLFAQNEAATFGASISNNGADTADSDVLLINSTFSFNAASEINSELSGFTDGSGTATFEMINCLFDAEDTVYEVEEGTPEAISLGGNVIVGNTGVDIFTESTDRNGVDGEDLFVNVRAEDYRLAPGSPAIDAGIPATGVPANDILGFMRDGRPDAGAFEYDESVNTDETRIGLQSLTLSPNPVADVTQLTFLVEREALVGASVELKLYSTSGTQLPFNQVFEAQQLNQLMLDVSAYPAGVYYLELNTQLGSVSHVLVKR